MTNDIREKAEALVKVLEKEQCCNVSLNEFKDLKAALRPPREEIASYLESWHNSHCGVKNVIAPMDYIKLAIEELRK